jgi:hypothetical protein
MSVKLNFGRDAQGYNAYAPPPAGDKYSATLSAGGNSTITLPTNVAYWIVSFSFQPGSDIWVNYNASAAAPAGTTFASTTSELLPGARILSSLQNDGKTATTINLLNNGSGTADVGVVLYQASMGPN